MTAKFPEEHSSPSDPWPLDDMFTAHRDRLLRMIEIRLTSDLRKCVEPEDILQETYLEAYRQLKNNISKPKGAPIVWLRLILRQKLIAAHRHYCKAKKRDVGREHSFAHYREVRADSLSLSGILVGTFTSPSAIARRNELIEKFRDCFDRLESEDREIISLRHFEQLTAAETAQELDLPTNAVTNRYVKALRHFKEILKEEGLDQLIES